MAPATPFRSTPLPFALRGMVISKPPDKLAPDEAAYLANVRQNGLGQMVARAGFTVVNSAALSTALHTLARLNLENSWTRLVGGADGRLYAGQTSFSAISFNGTTNVFSGSPLSITTIRPAQAPGAWAYVGDSTYLGKTNGTLGYNTGIAPPAAPPTAYQSITRFAEIDPLDSAVTSDWSNAGTAGSITGGNRISAITAGVVTYDPDGSGNCTVGGSGTWLELMGVGALITFSNGSEEVVIQAITPAVATTTIGSIIYRSGTTGWCSIVLAAPSSPVQQYSYLLINSGGGTQEYVTVMDVTPAADGTLALRCYTVNNHAAGESVNGQMAFRATTAITHAGGENLTATYLTAQVTAGTGTLSRTTISTVFSVVQGRAMQPEDYIHLSFWVDVPSLLTELQVNLDNDVGSSTAFTEFYLQATFTPDVFNQGESQWVELMVPISEFVQIGTSPVVSLATIRALQFSVVALGTINVRFAGWWIGGGYGPDIGDAGEPYQYRYRYRSSLTGAVSNSSQPSQVGLSPRRTQLNVVVQGSSDPQVDYADIERFGGTISPTGWHYIATVMLAPGANTYVDNADDANIVSAPALDQNNFQPFPVNYNPISGTLSASGTLLSIATGHIPSGIAPGTLINLNDQTYTISVIWASAGGFATTIEVAENVNTVGASSPYSIPNPIVPGTPLPAQWGPYPDALFIFACGDPLNPGTLYLTNPNNPDGASDANTLEVTSPSEPLINGAIAGQDSYVLTGERVFLLIPTFTNFQTGTGNYFQPQEIKPTRGHGLASTYALCTGGGRLWWLALDGICSTGGGDFINHTDADLYSLFEHAGQPAADFTLYGAGLVTNAPSFSSIVEGITAPRLAYSEGFLFFDYLDSGGNPHTLVLDTIRGGWSLDSYLGGVGRIGARLQEQAEDPSTSPQQFIWADSNGQVLAAGGTTDNGVAIQSTCATGAVDLGESARNAKEWGDIWLDAFLGASPNGASVQAWFNTYETSLAAKAFVGAGAWGEFIADLNSGAGQIARNLGVLITWASATPIFKQWAPSFVIKPEDTILRATDWDNCGSQGAKFMQGLRLEVDTQGVATTFNVQYDGGTAGATFTITASGQQVIPVSFTTPFIGHLVRLIQTSENVIRVFGLEWVSNPAPELVSVWITPPTTLGFRGYWFQRDMWIPYASTALSTLTILRDGVADPVYNLPITGGVETKLYLPALAGKQRLIQYKAATSGGGSNLQVYQQDLEIRARSWSDNGEFQVIRPFGDLNNTSGATI